MTVQCKNKRELNWCFYTLVTKRHMFDVPQLVDSDVYQHRLWCFRIYTTEAIQINQFHYLILNSRWRHIKWNEVVVHLDTYSMSNVLKHTLVYWKYICWKKYIFDAYKIGHHFKRLICGISESILVIRVCLVFSQNDSFCELKCNNVIPNQFKTIFYIWKHETKHSSNDVLHQLFCFLIKHNILFNKTKNN